MYVSSNGLPKIATEYQKDSPEYQDYWEPFLERVQFVQHHHRFNSEVDKPKFNYIHICHLWLKWYDQFSGCNSIPETMDVPRFDGKQLLRKRSHPDGPRVEMPSFKKKTEHDLRWKIQSQIQFGKDQILDAIPSSLPSLKSSNSQELIEQAHYDYLMDGQTI